MIPSVSLIGSLEKLCGEYDMRMFKKLLKFSLLKFYKSYTSYVAFWGQSHQELSGPDHFAVFKIFRARQ